jgi:cell division protein FtsB
MTEQQPPISISAEEMKAALERTFATTFGNLIIQNLGLEKQVAILQAKVAQLEAELTALNPHRATLTSEAARIAAAGDAAIIRGNEKAVPG